MPEWKYHWKFASKFIPIPKWLAREIDHFIDFPRVGAIKLPHKAIHNWFGIAAATARYGWIGGIYAALHIFLDDLVEGKYFGKKKRKKRKLF